MKKITAIFLFLCVSALGADTNQQVVSIHDSMHTPETVFAIGDLQKALNKNGYRVTDHPKAICIEIRQVDELQKQQYTIEKPNELNVVIRAGGAPGAMYGILDLAEQIQLGKSVTEVETKNETPFIEYRGIKMNIALDGRLPSYDDTGDAAQNNIAEMWNMDFWTEFLDDLARHRYNVLTFWSKHPFPALCKLEDYPGAAMDDVYVYNKSITWQTHRDWHDCDIQNKANLRLIKSMTIDEKIAFWQKVMEHAHNRGIDIAWFTWNIFISPGTGEIKNPESNEAKRYMRKAVQELVETYPHLSGFGVTAGENMGPTVGDLSAPGWMFETYGKGIIAVKEKDPDRSFRFIFRRHHADLPTIQKDFASSFPGVVETSYKYSVARMYSSPRPPIFERDYLADVKKYNYQCWMNVRNDDIFSFRWGDPDYVRAYLTGMKSFGVVPGFYMGSDGYLWGREFTAKNPNLSGELEIKKHWYRYMLWGRMAFNPNLKDAFWQAVLTDRFPEANSEDLFQAWRHASKVFPLVNTFHWKAGDELWAIEGCMDRAKGFQTIRDFIDCYTLEEDRLLNITDYIRALQNQEESTLLTPFDVADSLRLNSQKTHEYLNKLRNTKKASDGMEATLNDIECFALYGEYYAGKIAGATYLHMYECLDHAEKDSYQQKAIQEAEKAADAWKKLAQIAGNQYKVQLLARTRELDWHKTIQHVERDIEIVKTSTGREPKVAKLFYSGWAKITADQRAKLAAFLEAKGYTIEVYPGWKSEEYAAGLKIAVSMKGDVVMSQYYTRRGGDYPDDFEDTGVVIKKVNHKIWVMGKDIEHANQGIDHLIETLKTHPEIIQSNDLSWE